MGKEELMNTLRNFTEKQVNELPDNDKKLFYAIMDIADERDELKDRIIKAIEYINHEYFKREQIGINKKEFQQWQLEELLNILKGSE